MIQATSSHIVGPNGDKVVHADHATDIDNDDGLKKTQPCNLGMLVEACAITQKCPVMEYGGEISTQLPPVAPKEENKIPGDPIIVRYISVTV